MDLELFVLFLLFFHLFLSLLIVFWSCVAFSFSFFSSWSHFLFVESCIFSFFFFGGGDWFNFLFSGFIDLEWFVLVLLFFWSVSFRFCFKDYLLIILMDCGIIYFSFLFINFLLVPYVIYWKICTVKIYYMFKFLAWIVVLNFFPFFWLNFLLLS